MHDGVDIGPGMVDREVHRHPGGALAQASSLVSRAITHDKILGADAALTNSGGSGECVRHPGGPSGCGRWPRSTRAHLSCTRADDVFAKLLLATGHVFL